MTLRLYHLKNRMIVPSLQVYCEDLMIQCICENSTLRRCSERGRLLATIPSGSCDRWMVGPGHQAVPLSSKIHQNKNQRPEESTNSITSPWIIKTSWHITIHHLFSLGVPWWQEKLSPASLSFPSQIESSQRDCKSIPNIFSCLSYVLPELRRWL